MSWDIVYYRQADGRLPVDEFLNGCPVKVRARLLAVLDDVAEAPPPQFSGGGRWEAMHGAMRGYYEVRAQGPAREQFRLFCILEKAESEGVAATRAERPGDRRHHRPAQAVDDHLHGGRLPPGPATGGCVPGNDPSARC